MSTGVQETLRIATPEGVSLELPLAGVGSRFVALLVDTLLQGVIFVGVIVLLVVSGGDGFTAFAVMGFTVFSLLFVYPVAFELAAGGRTPGKRWSSLRVVCDNGSTVTFRASALRNLVRLVDMLPGLYLVGAIAIFATRNNQRLGDLAAGTIVVREPRAGAVATRDVRGHGGGRARRAAGLGRERPAARPSWPRCGASSNAGTRSTSCRGTCSRATSPTACVRASAAWAQISRPSGSSS